MSDLISRQALCEYALNQIDKSVTPNDIMRFPSAQPEPCDDPMADIYYLAEKIGIHRLYALVVELRGEPEPCEDTISRQQAITALRALSDEDGYINAPHEVVTDVVRGLPPVRAEHEQTIQSEQTKKDKFGVKAGKTYTDTISRKAAIDIIEDFPHGGVWNVESMEEMVYRIKQLPSAQPEIIHCRDCKHHWTHSCMDAFPREICDLDQTFYDSNIDYCSLAERRTDETD